MGGSARHTLDKDLTHFCHHAAFVRTSLLTVFRCSEPLQQTCHSFPNSGPTIFRLRKLPRPPIAQKSRGFCRAATLHDHSARGGKASEFWADLRCVHDNSPLCCRTDAAMFPFWTLHLGPTAPAPPPPSAPRDSRISAQVALLRVITGGGLFFPIPVKTLWREVARVDPAVGQFLARRLLHVAHSARRLVSLGTKTSRWWPSLNLTGVHPNFEGSVILICFFKQTTKDEVRIGS